MMDHPPEKELRRTLDAFQLRAEALQVRLDGVQGILDAISEAILIQNAEGRFLDVNEGAARMYGYPRDFFAGKTSEVLSVPGRSDLGAASEAFTRAIQGEPQQIEFWGLKADGAVFPQDIRLYPGTFLGQKVVIAIAQDITERKRAEQIRDAANRISEAALEAGGLQALYRSVHDILRSLIPAENCYIALHDPGTNTLDWPYWVDQMDEAPASRPFGRGLTEYVIRSGRSQLLEGSRLTALAEAGEAKGMGVEAISWMGVPLRNDRRVYGALVIQSYEGGYRYRPEDLELLSFVSAQIALAIDRKAAEAALRFSEEKFSRAVHASPDAINLSRLDDGTYLDVSEGFEKLTGWTRAESIGRTALDMNIWVDPADRQRIVELIRVHGEYTGLEIAFRRKDGTLLTGLMSGRNMEVGGVPCLLSITRDITDRKAAESALRHAQKLESLGILAGGIAHDFNNLLTVVLGNLNLAQMHLPENAEAQPYLANMEASVLRATELTKQMLAYSGRGHFLVAPQDLNGVVREVTHLLEVSISKKIKLKFDLESGLPALLADAAQIQQVVMNLVTNASDAIRDREGVIRLSTSTEFLSERELQSDYRGESLKAGPYILLEVADTGMGMAPDVMPRIFDPFFTTKATGRGLGLSAMLGILRGHGAGLRITSAVGRGSAFRICFPAFNQEAFVPAPATEGTAPGPLRGRILLVDDEESILQAIGSALQSFGLEVLTARDGLEALERFRDAQPRPDLVLMDLTMPRMDGREAFQAMHSLDPSVPIVLSSGFTEQDSVQTLSGQNPAGFIQKPYQIKELRQLLQRVLRS